MYSTDQLSLLLLLPLLSISPHTISAVQPTLIIAAAGSYRNPSTIPNTVEVPHNQSWQFSCRWTRANATEDLYLAIQAPKPAGQSNCQFKLSSGPAVCTPSSVQFPTDSGVDQKLNLTCIESGNTLTCSMDIDRFNPRHIGEWSCLSMRDDRSDRVYLQYFKPLPNEGLVLASWDPIEPINDTAGHNVTNNRFECFTKLPVIPPPRIAFYLGGIELTTVQTRYPVDWLSNTTYSVQPIMYSLNGTAAAKIPPRTDLALNQQLLASSRILEIRLRRSYNGLLLQCVAHQGLSDEQPVASQEITLHLESSDLSNAPDGSGGSEAPANRGGQLPLWLTAGLAALWLSDAAIMRE